MRAGKKALRFAAPAPLHRVLVATRVRQDGVVTGEQALGVGGLDECLTIPHVVGVTVGEQDGAQGEPMGAKQSQRAAGGTSSGVDDEGGPARARGPDGLPGSRREAPPAPPAA